MSDGGLSSCNFISGVMQERIKVSGWREDVLLWLFTICPSGLGSFISLYQYIKDSTHLFCPSDFNYV